jgi:hypothetical protein
MEQTTLLGLPRMCRQDRGRQGCSDADMLNYGGGGDGEAGGGDGEGGGGGGEGGGDGDTPLYVGGGKGVGCALTSITVTVNATKHPGCRPYPTSCSGGVKSAWRMTNTNFAVFPMSLAVGLKTIMAVCCVQIPTSCQQGTQQSPDDFQCKNEFVALHISVMLFEVLKVMHDRSNDATPLAYHIGIYGNTI